MMRLIKTIVFLTAFFASAALPLNANSKEKVRLGSHFSVSEFNNVASQFYDRATFLELVVRKKKPDQMWIWVDFIQKSENAKYFNGNDFISLSESAVDEYIGAIDKYIKWREIALRDGDLLTKEIARPIGRKKSLKVKFSFYSGNKTNHYLTMQTCSLGTCLEPTFYLDYANAVLMKETFVKWKSGELNGVTEKEVDEKYK